MCLGIPGKVIETRRTHDVLMGEVDSGGERLFIRLAGEQLPRMR
jgi:hypothetical protein